MFCFYDRKSNESETCVRQVKTNLSERTRQRASSAKEEERLDLLTNAKKEYRQISAHRKLYRIHSNNRIFAVELIQGPKSYFSSIDS